MTICRLVHYAVFLLTPLAVFPQSRTVISGTLLGADGNPMPLAHVHIDGPIGHGNNLVELRDVSYGRVEASRTGEFVISTDSTGPFYLVFTGVEHQMLEVPVVLGGQAEIRMEVRLAAFEYLSEFEFPQVVYDFDEVSRGRQLPLNRLPDGTYSVEFPASKDAIVYRIINIGGSFLGVATAAASSDSFVYYDWGIYSSVIHPRRGSVRITLNPSALAHSRSPAEVRFQPTNATESRIYLAMCDLEAIKRKRDELFQKHIASGGTPSSFTYDSRAQVASVVQRIESMPGGLLREELILESLELAGMSTFPCDSARLRSAAREVPATSPAWAFHGSLPLQSFQLLNGKADYIEEIIEHHPSRSYGALLLFRQCSYAKNERRKADRARLYARLVTQFPDTPPARMAMEVLRADPGLRVGSSMPAFSFPALDDTTIVYTSQSFRGTYVLLDFWATWCVPCIEEMTFLERAYQRYRQSGLDILSISLDESRVHVQEFRKARYPMPWKNAYVAKSMHPETIAAYDVTFPKPILVDPTGRIVVMEDSLRGASLERTLAKHIQPGR